MLSNAIQVEVVHTLPTTSVTQDNAQMLSAMEQLIVDCARTSFNGSSKGYEKDLKLLKYLYDHKHSTPFEMATFLLRITMPEVVWRQLVRYRWGTFNARSGRYTEYDETFYVPDQWRRQSKTNKQGSEGFVDEDTSRFFSDLLDAHQRRGYQFYRDALQHGIAKEQARLFLAGFSTITVVVWKVDAHNLAHVIRQRISSDAQYEMQALAHRLLAIYKQYLPHVGSWLEEEISHATS